MTIFNRRQFITATTTIAFGLAAFEPTLAQAQGTALRVIMPFSPGSGVDTIVRGAQTGLSKAFNRPIVIENLPGAGGIMAPANW